MNILILNKKQFIEKHNITEYIFNEQLDNFLDYRTEKSINWKKEKWKKEKTFDPVRRFNRRLKKYNEWKPKEEIDSSKFTLEEKEKILSDKGLF